MTITTSLDGFLADAEKKVQKKKVAAHRVKPKKEKEEIQEPLIPPWDRLHGNSLYDYYDL